MTAPRPTVTSLIAAGRLTPPTITALAGDPYVHHYARHEAIVDGLASLLDVAEIIDLAPVLTVILPGIRKPLDCWTDLTEPLQQYRDLDGNEAVSIEQERGQRAPNAVDSYARVVDELRQECGAVIRRHRKGCPTCWGKGRIEDRRTGCDWPCVACDGSGDAA